MLTGPCVLQKIWLSGLIINFIWPLPDRNIAKLEDNYRIEMLNRKANILLVLISDKKPVTNNKNDKFNEHLIDIIMIRIDESKKVRVDSISKDINYLLPGNSLNSLEEIYKIGDISLLEQVISELLSLESRKTNRYALLKSSNNLRYITQINKQDLLSLISNSTDNVIDTNLSTEEIGAMRRLIENTKSNIVFRYYKEVKNNKLID